MNNGKGHQLAPLNGRSVLEAVCPQCPLVTDITGLYRRLEILDRAKSDFIQIASHELRTPLALIKGYTEEVVTLEAGLQLLELLRLLTSLGSHRGDTLPYSFNAKIDFHGFVPTQRVKESGEIQL